MNTRQVDVAVIGSGSAGLNARRQVEKAGGRPLLIESGPYGTTCARVGCMPSKLLIAAGDAAHEVAHANRFGISVGDDWRVDGAAVLERVRRERDRFVSFVVADTEALPEEQRLLGHARFVGPNTLQVDDHTRVEANAVVIATGSSPFIPPPFDAIREQVLINDDVFELQQLPRRLAVVGTGIIGLELGQALQRLGVEVTFFTPFEALGAFTDPEVVAVTREILGAELNLQTGARISAAVPKDEGIQLTWSDAGGAARDEHFDQVLVAAGRRPNLSGLDLGKAGIVLNEQGRPAWDARTTQVGTAPIFLAGDVSG
ncbi:MAG: FAD-dependent oxidoreductase, partial [Gammaproteobacteria bacterium]